MELLKLFYSKFLTILIVLSIGAPAFSQDTCQSLFAKKTFIEWSKNLIIKDAPAYTPQTKYFGFLTKVPEGSTTRSIRIPLTSKVFIYDRFLLNNFIKLNRTYAFTPGAAIDTLIFDKLMHLASKKTIGKKKELGFISKFILGGLLSYQIGAASIETFDHYYFEPRVQNNIAYQYLKEIEKNPSHYDHLIDTGYLYRTIKNDLKKSESENHNRPVTTYRGDAPMEYIESTPQMRARISALDLEQSYRAYYYTYTEFVKKNNRAPESLQEHIGLITSHERVPSLFNNVSEFFNDVESKKGFYVPPQHRGPISEHQKLELLNHTHLLFFKYRVIEDLFGSEKEIQKFLATNEIARSIYNQDYTQKLIALHIEGRITKDQLVYLLQEDARLMYYMKIFKILHIVPLKNENGQYTKPLTLNDFREERLLEIK